MINFIFIYLLLLFVLVSPSLMKYRIPPVSRRKDGRITGPAKKPDRSFKYNSSARHEIQYG